MENFSHISQVPERVMDHALLLSVSGTVHMVQLMFPDHENPIEFKDICYCDQCGTVTGQSFHCPNGCRPFGYKGGAE